MFYAEDHAGLCRACFSTVPARQRECAVCGDLRLVVHKELFTLSIAHLDCDAFYAAIEKRDNPALVDKPVIVGGARRGVVATCCYIARTYGVRSAMPMFKALKACPDAVVIKPNMAKYAEAGHVIRQLMLELTPLVQPISIDEAFLDLTGTERLHHSPPAVTLAKLQMRIENAVGVTASIGLSHNKFLAKIASDLDKPRGFSVIGKAETKSFLARQPVSLIWGVGKATTARMKRDGISTIGQLQQIDAATLTRRYGETGARLARLAHGDDTRAVSPSRASKSVSSETTFNEDISDLHALEDILWDLCEKVSARMKQKNYEGRVVVLKLKTSKFQTLTRRSTLAAPTNLARSAFDAARRMLHEASGERAFRLIGVGFSELRAASNSFEAGLFDDGGARVAAQEGAVDAIRKKFGDAAIGVGRSLRRRLK